MLECDALIIGSGIAGMTSAIYLKRAGINTIVVERDAPGGQLNRSSIVENYPGFVNIDGPSLAFNIFSQVSSLDIPYLYDSVLGLEEDDGFYIVKTKEKEIKTKYVIIANGRRPRKLGLPNEEELIGKGISYCALCDGNLYKDKNVAIVGGGNSALEEALHLSKIAKKVTIIHRKDKYTAFLEMINEVEENKRIVKIFNSNIIKITKDKNNMLILELDTGKKVKVAALFISIGYIPNTEIYEKIEKENGYILVNEKGETNLKNVFACGDIIKKNTYQLVTAAGEGANIANNIIKKIK